MQNICLIPLSMLTYNEGNNVLLLSVIPTTQVVGVYAACMKVPTLLMNHLGMIQKSHDGISEVPIGNRKWKINMKT